MITINMISQSYHIFLLFHREIPIYHQDKPLPKKETKPNNQTKQLLGDTPLKFHIVPKKNVAWETGTLLGELN